MVRRILFIALVVNVFLFVFSFIIVGLKSFMWESDLMILGELVVGMLGIGMFKNGCGVG